MARIFNSKGISASGLILPYADFTIYSDMADPKLDPEQVAPTVKRAEGHLTKDIPFLPLSLYRDFFITGNRNNFETPYFARRSMAIDLAVAEMFERKGRFIDKLADVIYAIMEESSWILPAHTIHSPSRPRTEIPEVFGENHYHGIDLFSATTASTLAVVYRYLKDELDAISPLISERIAYELHIRAIEPFTACSFRWSGEFGNKPNNWCPWICASILYTVAVAEKDTYVRERAAQKVMDYLDNFTSFYNADGGCDEGPGYWAHAGGSMFDCLEILEDMSGGRINVYSDPLVKAIGEYEAKVNIHADRFVNFADCHGKLLADGYLLTRFGKKCGSDALISFGADMATRAHANPNSSAPYRSIKDLMTPPITERPAPSALTRAYLDGLKVMVCRESQDSARGMFFAMKGGSNGESHNHNDVGSFIVYYDGKPVLIDVGVGQYTKQTFSPDRYKLWFMQSNYHNLPTFDGIGEMQGGIYASKNEVFDEASASFCVDIEGAYPDTAGVVKYTRRGALDGARIILDEDITLDKERKICFHFMTHEQPTFTRGRIALPAGRTLIYDSDVLECHIEEFLAEGLDAEREWGSAKLWRIHLTVTASAYKGRFIVE